MAKSIIIIGAGMGGMAAGIYGQMNGYDTRIFEMHSIPGGECTSWKRKGYTFDVCLHHLMGCAPGSKIYKLWEEIGAMPRKLAYTKECVSVVSPDGNIFYDYYDLDMLREHLYKLAPNDSKIIDEYIGALKPFVRADLMGELMMGGLKGMLKLTPTFLKTFKWFKPTMADFASRFTNPFLQRAFPMLEYSMPIVPFAVHLAKHADGTKKNIAWPVGSCSEFAASIAGRYESLGGRIHYRQRVTKILTKDDKAVGVRLEDGSEEYADMVISNADGRKTLLELLEGKYLDTKLKKYCGEPEDETNWAVHVFLGVNRDLSNEPSSMVMLLDNPVTIAGHENHSIELQTYGMDNTMAPEGKGVIKVELVSKYSYWKKLSKDKTLYEAEKHNTACQVIDILDSYFHGIKGQVEVIDVPTLLTWERFMGGTHGFANGPNKKMDIIGSIIKNGDMTVPGLGNFYFTGMWATSTGALFANALSGKKVIQYICRQDGKRCRVVK